MSSCPPGMTAEKLDKIADYVSLLDRMDIDLANQKVTFQSPRPDETEMQDDLRTWARHIREAPPVLTPETAVAYRDREASFAEALATLDAIRELARAVIASGGGSDYGSGQAAMATTVLDLLSKDEDDHPSP